MNRRTATVLLLWGLGFPGTVSAGGAGGTPPSAAYEKFVEVLEGGTVNSVDPKAERIFAQERFRELKSVAPASKIPQIINKEITNAYAEASGRGVIVTSRFLNTHQGAQLLGLPTPVSFGRDFPLTYRGRYFVSGVQPEMSQTARVYGYRFLGGRSMMMTDLRNKAKRVGKALTNLGKEYKTIAPLGIPLYGREEMRRRLRGAVDEFLSAVRKQRDMANKTRRASLLSRARKIKVPFLINPARPGFGANVGSSTVLSMLAFLATDWAISRAFSTGDPAPATASRRNMR